MGWRVLGRGVGGFLAPPVPSSPAAETFSFFMFQKNDSLLLRNSSEMRDDLTRNLLYRSTIREDTVFIDI